MRLLKKRKKGEKKPNRWQRLVLKYLLSVFYRKSQLCDWDAGWETSRYLGAPPGQAPPARGRAGKGPASALSRSRTPRRRPARLGRHRKSASATGSAETHLWGSSLERGGPAWKGGLQPGRGWPRSARPHTTGSSRRGLRKDERCSLTPSADHREGFRARVGNAVTSPRSSQPPTAGASSLPLWGGQPRDSARSASRSVTFEAALRGRGCRSAHAQTPPQPRSPRRLWGSPRRGGVRPSWSPRLEGSQGGRTRIVCLLNILS